MRRQKRWMEARMSSADLVQRNGFGSAYAVLLFLLVIPVVVINRRAQQRAEEQL